MAVQTPVFDSDGDNTAQAATLGQGWLTGFEIRNPNTTVAYVQFFNAAVANVTVGTTSPNAVYEIPPGDGVTPGVSNQDFGNGIYFPVACTYACTTTETGSGDPTTGLSLTLRISQ